MLQRFRDSESRSRVTIKFPLRVTLQNQMWINTPLKIPPVDGNSGTTRITTAKIQAAKEHTKRALSADTDLLAPTYPCLETW